MNRAIAERIEAYKKGYADGRIAGEKLASVSYQMLACGFIAALKPFNFDADALGEVLEGASKWIIDHDGMTAEQMQKAMEDEMGVELNIWS